MSRVERPGISCHTRGQWRCRKLTQEIPWMSDLRADDSALCHSLERHMDGPIDGEPCPRVISFRCCATRGRDVLRILPIFACLSVFSATLLLGLACMMAHSSPSARRDRVRAGELDIGVHGRVEAHAEHGALPAATSGHTCAMSAMRRLWRPLKCCRAPPPFVLRLL